MLSAGSGSKSGLDSDFASIPASLSQLRVGRGAMEGEGELVFGVSVSRLFLCQPDNTDKPD